VTMTLLALAAIMCGYAIVVIDPKGDDFMLRELRKAPSVPADGSYWSQRGGTPFTTPTRPARTPR
jgi:hypothetical protein